MPVVVPPPQGSPLSLPRPSSRDGNGSDSVNWRERNGAGNGLSDFPSSVGSPKRKQNKSGQSTCTAPCVCVRARACVQRCLCVHPCTQLQSITSAAATTWTASPR